MNTWHRQRATATRLSQSSTADTPFWQSLTKAVTIKVTPAFADLIQMYANAHNMSVGEIYRRGALMFMVTANPVAIQVAEDVMIAGMLGQGIPDGITNRVGSARNGHKALGGSSDRQAENEG